MNSLIGCIGLTLIPAAAFCMVAYLVTLLVVEEARASLARKARSLVRFIRGDFAPKPRALTYGPARRLTPGLPVDGRPLDDDEQRRLDTVVRDSWEVPA